MANFTIAKVLEELNEKLYDEHEYESFCDPLIQRCKPEEDLQEIIKGLQETKPLNYGNQSGEAKEKRKRHIELCARFVLYIANCEMADELPF